MTPVSYPIDTAHQIRELLF